MAGILEIYRKKDIEENGVIQQELSKHTFNASSISIFAQVPQFALVGASEVFASVSGEYDLIRQNGRSEEFFWGDFTMRDKLISLKFPERIGSPFNFHPQTRACRPAGNNTYLFSTIYSFCKIET